jgi:hypothetical protein
MHGTRQRRYMQTQHTCNNCKYGGWYRKGYDITMMDEECGGCTESNEKWESDCKPDGIILDDDGY